MLRAFKTEWETLIFRTTAHSKTHEPPRTVPQRRDTNHAAFGRFVLLASGIRRFVKNK